MRDPGPDPGLWRGIAWGLVASAVFFGGVWLALRGGVPW